MKENLKKILFIISIFYSLVIIVLMLVTTSNLTYEIELYDNEENLKELESYKKELLSLNSNDCTKVIENIITYYENTSYNGKVNLKEMYNSNLEESFLSFYNEAKNNCNITDEDTNKYRLPNKFITASIQRDELYRPYMFQYELNIKDFYMRDIIEPDLPSMEYKINRESILEIISSLIEHVKEEK